MSRFLEVLTVNIESNNFKKMLEAEVCTAMNMGMKVAFYLGHLVRRQIYKFP